jgi:DnaJ-class molecular chaperone
VPVRIPAGVRNAQRLVLRRQAGVLNEDGEVADVYLVVRVAG